MTDARTDLGQTMASDPPDDDAGAAFGRVPVKKKAASIRRRRFFPLLTVILVAVFLAVVLLFVQFAETISGMTKPVGPQADGIVVLTGGKARVLEGLKLLEAGGAERLLISGVHPGTTREQLAAVTASDLPLQTCCVDLDKLALNTKGNAAETANWARKYGYKRLLVVTSAYHLPRATAELLDVLPDADLIAYPVSPVGLDLANWYKHPRTIRLLMREYVKYILARLRIATSG